MDSWSFKKGIGATEVGARLATGEWYRSQDLDAEMLAYSMELIRRFPPGERMQDEQMSLAFKLEREALDRYEHDVIEDPLEGMNRPTAGFRLGPGSVVKLGPAIRNLVPKAIAFAGFIVATAPVGCLFYSALVSHVYQIFETLKSAWEKIEDPDELLVFEAIAAISSQIRVLNHEALSREDFMHAYGREAPFFEDIGQKLAGQLESRTIEKSLISLKARGILTKRDDRWLIAF